MTNNDIFNEYEPIHPGKIEIAKEVCCEFACGGMNCNYGRKISKYCSNNNNCIRQGFKLVFAVIGVVVLIVGLLYLLLFPLSSMTEGFMFSDIKCDIWTGCNVYAINGDGNQLSFGSYYDHDYIAFMCGILSFLMSFFLIISLAGVIILLIYRIRCNYMIINNTSINNDNYRHIFTSTEVKTYKVRFNWSLIGLIYLCWLIIIPIAFHFHFAKFFSSYANPECTKFIDLPYVYGYYIMRNSDGYWDTCGYSDCCPFKRLGFLKGVQYDSNLIWDVNSCMYCKSLGWKYVSIPLLVPVGIVLLGLLCLYFGRRCKNTIQEVNQRYENLPAPETVL